MVGAIGFFDGMHADIAGGCAAIWRATMQKPLAGLVEFLAERGNATFPEILLNKGFPHFCR
jgi:hypothetical protein